MHIFAVVVDASAEPVIAGKLAGGLSKADVCDLCTAGVRYVVTAGAFVFALFVDSIDVVITTEVGDTTDVGDTTTDVDDVPSNSLSASLASVVAL